MYEKIIACCFIAPNVRPCYVPGSIDQLWIGEAGDYDTPPDYWLVEISGIPFGLPSQMLQDGGNTWRGMVYGMTNRAGWTGNAPDHIWQFWDKHGIKDKTMTGYWDPAGPVKTDNDSIKVTVYKKGSSAILALGNFSNSDQACSLTIKNWGTTRPNVLFRSRR